MRCGYLSKQTDGHYIKSHITTHIYLKITKRENILMQQNLCYFRENIADYFIYFILQYLEGFKISQWISRHLHLGQNTPLHTNTSTSQVQLASC